MNIKKQVKRQIRRAVLESMRLASRPKLGYKPNQPDLTRPPRKLLLLRPDHLGDVLLTTPALALLRRALPQTEITALVGPWGAASLQNNPDVDKISRIEFPGFSRQPKTNFFAPYLYSLQQSRLLRQQEYDAAISFRYDHWWGALLLYLADIPARFGYNWAESNSFLTHRLSLDPGVMNSPGFSYGSEFGQSPRHTVSLSLALASFTLQQYGLSPDKGRFEGQDLKLKYLTSAEDLRFASLILSEWGINPSDKLVAIHPGSGATIKLWTAEGFAAVADTIAQKLGAKVILVGSEGEKALLENIVKSCRTEPLLWDSGNSFGRLAGLFSRCNLVLGLDSGPLHLAVAAGTPTIHLFGPTDPAIFGPWGDPIRHRVIRTELDLPCLPCGVLDPNRSCWHGGYCMRTIKTTQVIEAAAAILNKNL